MRRLKTAQNPPNNYVLEPGFDIGMGEFRVGNEVLFSSGASTCILLAAYNSATRQGLVGHFTALESTRKRSDAEEFAEAVNTISKLGDPAATQVWLGGAACDSPELEEPIFADREHALLKLRQAGIPDAQLTIDWAEDKKDTHVELNCPMGILVIYNTDRLE